MYTLIGTPGTRTFRVLWILEEIGAPYTHEAAPPRSPRATALNASGKVPILLVDETPLTDSTAILTYLADRHGQLTFPAGSIERARQDGLTNCLLDEFDALIWTATRHSFVLPPEQRLPAIKDSIRWEFARNAARLADRLGDGPFLMGEAFDQALGFVRQTPGNFHRNLDQLVTAPCANFAFVASRPTSGSWKTCSSIPPLFPARRRSPSSTAIPSCSTSARVSTARPRRSAISPT